jgi:pimeloyl-ACP methyl ester carboxylesterase
MRRAGGPDDVRPNTRGRRRAGVAIGLAAIVGLAGCSGSAAESPETVGPTEAAETVLELEIGGQKALAFVPPQDLAGLVIYAHGVGDDHDVLSLDDKRVEIVDRLLADGYVVAASDAHFDAFGNAASQQDYVALAEELTQRYGTSRTFLIAESMGGVAALQLLASDRIPDLLGVAAISPLVDPRVLEGTDLEEPVLAAYGGEFPTGTDNPAQLPADAYEGANLRFYLAAEDTVTVSAVNADPLAERLRDVANVSVVDCDGEHVDSSCFQPDDLADWFGTLTEAAPPPR